MWVQALLKEAQEQSASSQLGQGPAVDREVGNSSQHIHNDSQCFSETHSAFPLLAGPSKSSKQLHLPSKDSSLYLSETVLTPSPQILMPS